MNDIRKLSPVEIRNFARRFYRNEFPHQRFGQAFLNEFYPNLACPELFYEEDGGKAQEYIFNNFINWEESSITELMTT